MPNRFRIRRNLQQNLAVVIASGDGVFVELGCVNSPPAAELQPLSHIIHQLGHSEQPIGLLLIAIVPQRLGQ